MAGTKNGGIKATATNKERHGSDFYSRIGAMGGRNGHTGGFGSERKGSDGLTGPERARIAGAKGGKISRRGKTINKSQPGLSAGYIAGRKSKGSL